MPPDFLMGTKKYKTANNFEAVLIDKIQIDGKFFYRGYVEEAPYKELFWDENGFNTLTPELTLAEGIIERAKK